MIIFADDVGTGDVPGYWNTGLVNMPNLQDLVAHGTTFLDAHSTPLCAPSRYVLLSGNYPHRGRNLFGTWLMNGVGSQFLKGQKSIAEVFRDNGYNTAMYGKWHLGGEF
jgi:arylsulfatase A